MRSLLRHIILSLAMLGVLNIHAQSYSISNATVNDCFANFTDSDAGNSVSPSFYGHNEDYTFSICPNGADSIVLSFASFCSELNLDFITFYDGPDLSSPQIGISYSGIVNIPPIIATSGCLTVHFVSDASVACEGWQASWVSIINTPANPTFAPIPNPLCNTNSFTLTLDQDVVCSAVNAGSFNIFGPSNQSVTSITPINCSNGTSNTVQVDFAPGLNANGNYTLQFSSDFLDACDSLWQLTAFGNFTVNDCPISVEIQSPDTIICTGTCTTLEAVASGGDGSYNYTWNNGLPASAGPHIICPLSNTIYTCTVTDGAGAPAGFVQVIVEVIPPAVLPANFTICQSDPNVDLDAVPNSGYWDGPCFGNDTLAGIFHPGWCGTGVKTIYYNNGGCIDSMEITVNPMSVGATNKLVCPGSPPFNIWTNNPGGVFTGNGITDSLVGTFNPVLAGLGVHNVIYSNPPCTNRTKIITVGTATIQADDTVCINSDRFTPVFNPKGGTWTGPGVTNWYWCRFDAAIAGSGTHELIYTYGSCSDTLRMTVIDIDAGSNMTVCPAEAPFSLAGNPLGGVWTGAGVIDSILGIFDPGFNGGNNFNTYLTYTLNGCGDSIQIYGRNTVIGYSPLGSFCNYDSDLTLNYSNTQRSPGGGAWSGNGITNPNANGTFSPSIAGTGNHYLYYLANTCLDSTLVTLFPDPMLSDTSICLEHSAFDLEAMVPGGFWNGDGIVNPIAGTFLPVIAGVGVHSISYLTPDSCIYYMDIRVDSLPAVNLTGLPELWCFADTNFLLVANPLGGVWSGASSDSILNPIVVGSGVHTINYTIGSGECAINNSKSIQVLDTLKITVSYSDTSVCQGEYLRISAEALGGDFLNYSFDWDNNLGGSSEIVFQVDSNNTYTVTLNDGCSDEVSASIIVNVYPSFELQFDSSDAVCYGEQGWLKVIPNPPGLYAIEWNQDSALSLDSIPGIAGRFYDVHVIDQNTGCVQSNSIQIPSFGQIIADFLSSPNDRCLDLLDPEFYFIDQSIGGDSGAWSFGDGTGNSYTPFANLYHEYQDTGTFEVVLQIVNGGGCIDQQVLRVCVKPKTLVIAPTAFSPNNDGINDVFFLRSIGANAAKLSIFNRWGEMVFQSSDLEQAWDGSFLGSIQEVGTYTWHLSYFSVENKKEELEKGSFQLIR
ncbi:MAG: gliding motility-associated C-terminal domain-containing protein [Chitinophagales bacterium]